MDNILAMTIVFSFLLYCTKAQNEQYNKGCNAYVQNVMSYCVNVILDTRGAKFPLQSLMKYCRQYPECDKELNKCILMYLTRGPGEKCVFAQNLARTLDRKLKS
ncbi:unnamed protein product [Heterobilharzia americana]|nr:unnamed protein product [Heterobilharzia americana]CAH8441176.1 unnamed protein product [Heterobilharzia americana]